MPVPGDRAGARAGGPGGCPCRGTGRMPVPGDRAGGCWTGRWRRAARRDGTVTVETESLTPARHELLAARGLQQAFAEDVVRIGLTEGVPKAVWPAGTTLREWARTARGGSHLPVLTGQRHHLAVGDASHRLRGVVPRPAGFPGLVRRAVDRRGDRRRGVPPRWSVPADVPAVGDAGFVTAAVDRIVQVGVAPAARGRTSARRWCARRWGGRYRPAEPPHG